MGIPENTWEYLEYLEYLEYRNTCGISGRVRGIPRVDDPSKRQRVWRQPSGAIAERTQLNLG